MGKPILYIADISPLCKTVLLTAKAIELDLELVVIDIYAGDSKKPEYIKMNPQHSVPTLDDNGKYITDSHAISTYLVNKYGKSEYQSLAPTDDLYERAVVESRLHFNDSVLLSRLLKIIFPLFRGVSKTFNEDDHKSVLESFDFLEAFLQNGDYVSGDKLTVADFAVVSVISMYYAIKPVDTTRHQKIAAWLDRLSKLEYYEDIIIKSMISFKNTIDEKIKNIA